MVYSNLHTERAGKRLRRSILIPLKQSLEINLQHFQDKCGKPITTSFISGDLQIRNSASLSPFQSVSTDVSAHASRSIRMSSKILDRCQRTQSLLIAMLYLRNIFAFKAGMPIPSRRTHRRFIEDHKTIKTSLPSFTSSIVDIDVDSISN